jgi:hypothetical protein
LKARPKVLKLYSLPDGRYRQGACGSRMCRKCMVGRSPPSFSPARKSLKRDGWLSRSWLKRNCGSSGLPSLAALSSAAVWSVKEAGSTAAS